MTRIRDNFRKHRLVIPLLLTGFYVLLHPGRGLSADIHPVYPDSLFNAGKKSIEACNYPAAIVQFNEYLALAIQLKNDLMRGNAHIGMGIAYERSGDYENGLRHYFAALRFYEQVANRKKVAGTLKNIGNVYRLVRSYDKSLAILQQAFTAYDALADSTGTGNVLNDIGIVYLDQRQYTLASETFTRVLTGYQHKIKEEVQAMALNNLALCLMQLEEYDKALYHYQAASTLMRKRNDAYGSALVRLNIAELFYKQGNLQAAIRYGNESINMASSLQSKGLLSAAYKTMANAYLQLKDYRQASQYLAAQLRFKDTMFREESARSYAEMETKYQTEKKQSEILKLEHLNTIKNSEIRTQRLQRNLLVTGLAGILLISFILWRNYVVKRAANRQLNLLNIKLHEANASKTKLFSILSHDLRTPVSSLFSFLQLQKESPGRLSPEEVAAYDEEVSDAAEYLLDSMEDLLIWSKSQMENFSPVYERVHLSRFTDEMIRMHAPAAVHKNVELLKCCPDHLAILTDNNFLKIICRNLIANAIKFTPPGGRVIISTEAVDGCIRLRVTDNGKGIVEKDLEAIFDWDNIRSDSSGLGLRLAKEFCEKLHGAIRVKSTPGEGTSFIIDLPDKAAGPA